IETSIRPLSSPWSVGFAVFGKLTSWPCSSSGATTMKMISSTSTTSTSGVMLMAACILIGSPSRMRHLRLFHLPELRRFEQTIYELGRSPVHLNVGIFYLAREVVECDDGGDRDEDTQSGRDQGLSNTARDHAHPAGPRGRDAPESVDDSDDGSEQPDERRRGADRGQESETPSQLDQRLGHRVPECALNELKRSDRIASALAHAAVLKDARRDHLRDVRRLVLRQGVDQLLDLSPTEEILEHRLEHLRLAHGRAETSLLLNDHGQ